MNNSMNNYRQKCSWSSDHLCLSLPPLTSKLKFSDRSFRNASPRLWKSLPTNLRSLSQQIPTPSSPTPLPFNKLFQAVSFSPASKHIYSLFHTPLNSPPSSPIYGFQPVTSAPLVTRVSTQEYTNTNGFTGGYIKRLFTYLLLIPIRIMNSARVSNENDAFHASIQWEQCIRSEYPTRMMLSALISNKNDAFSTCVQEEWCIWRMCPTRMHRLAAAASSSSCHTYVMWYMSYVIWHKYVCMYDMSCVI